MSNKKIKKKKAKKKTLRFFVFGIFCVATSCGITISISKIWTQIYDKYKEKKELEEKLVQLKKEENNLTLDVEKLKDPEYIGRYLREKYYYSKDGEYIIRMPDE